MVQEKFMQKVHLKQHLISTNQNMMLSGSIERVLPNDLLQSLAKADLVLSIDNTNMIMDENAQIQFYKNLARNGVLEAIFSTKNEGFGIILNGNLNSR